MCSKSVARLILLVFNVAFVIMGIICISLGAYVYSKKDDFGEVLERIPVGDEAAKDAINHKSFLEISAIVLIVTGTLVFLIAFFACCGALTERTILLDVYTFTVLLILLAQISAGIVAVVYRDKVEEKLMDFLQETITEDYEKGVRLEGDKFILGDKAIDIGWDLAQVTFECCGAANYTDWDNAQNFNRNYSGTYKEKSYDVTNAKVPISCCKLKNPDKYPDKLGELEFVDLQQCLESGAEASTNQEGCYEEIKDRLRHYATILVTTGILIGLLEIIGVVSSWCLCSIIAKERKDYKATD